MVDKDTILQVICGLMQRPQYLSEKDRYSLSIDDFSSAFEKYVFAAIYNLYNDGAQTITVADIDNYFNVHPTAKSIFEKNNGIEYLQDALEFSQAENFPFYYKRLKKFNCLRDLQKLGINTSYFYEEDLTNPKAKDINDKFEELEVSQIFEKVKKDLTLLETNYSVGDASESHSITHGINELIEELKISPEVGAPLQGKMFNTVCRGARKTKFYVRSASSGTGKTRAAIGDACYLAYPVRFNTENWVWEWEGSCEKTLFIATEQDLDEVQTLVLAYLTGFNEEKILYSNYNNEEYKVLQQALQVMKTFEQNLFVVRLSNPNIEQIKAVVRQHCILYDIANVFYDYIFSSPSLLNEFRDLRIREDVALMMLSTALKDLAVELNIFIMSSTQTNAKSDEEQKGIKNESVIRGARSIIDKCDIACVISRVTREDEERLAMPIEKVGIIPNQVMDIYKVRRGRYTNVRIWSYVDLGTCRKKDLFITDEKFQETEGFKIKNHVFDEDTSPNIISLLKDLNEDLDFVPNQEIFTEAEEVVTEEKINLDNVVEKDKKGVLMSFI